MAKKRKPKPLFFIICFLGLALIACGVICIFLVGPVDKNNDDVIEVEIEDGSTVSGIGSVLKEKGLIRSELLFKYYVKFSDNSSLKASNYEFKKSMSLNEIIDYLKKGSSYNPNEFKITFREGCRITDYAKAISEKIDSSYDDVLDVFVDRDYNTKLISKYWFLTEEILNPDIIYPLEGYIAPDTYFFDDTAMTPQEVIEKLLDETDKKFSPYKDKLSTNIHYYLTMASMCELEGKTDEDRSKIVGVFENRLKIGMALGSDVTTYYGLQVPMDDDLTKEQFNSINGYNTRSATMAGKMPAGPICNPSIDSINSSLNPIASDDLFFVADKHGKVYFTKTMAEHEAKIAEIKAAGNWIW